jgi:hypothetical protein
LVKIRAEIDHRSGLLEFIVSRVSRALENYNDAEMSRELAWTVNSGFSGFDYLHRHSKELGL